MTFFQLYIIYVVQEKELNILNLDQLDQSPILNTEERSNMNVINVRSLSSLNTKTNENVKIATAAKQNNLNGLKQRLNEQQIQAVQEVMKRFK